MICELCGNVYKTTCQHCSRRVITWGENGTKELIEMSKRTDDITAEELLKFVFEFYSGRITHKRSAVSTTLKTSLRILGYKGKFLGRIHSNATDYSHTRKRIYSSGLRWRIRKDKCEKCNSTDRLKLHHIIPVSLGGDASEENCITLCESCHRHIHKKLSVLLGREKILEFLLPNLKEISELSKKSLE